MTVVGRLAFAFEGDLLAAMASLSLLLFEWSVAHSALSTRFSGEHLLQGPTKTVWPVASFSMTLLFPSPET